MMNTTHHFHLLQSVHCSEISVGYFYMLQSKSSRHVSFVGIRSRIKYRGAPRTFQDKIHNFFQVSANKNQTLTQVLEPTSKIITHNSFQVTSCPHHSTCKLLLSAKMTTVLLMLIAAANQQHLEDKDFPTVQSTYAS
jgi:hypothetical protein